MSQTRAILFFIGRALISLIFLMAGAKKILNWHQVESGVAATLSEWYIYLGKAFFVEWLMSYTSLLLGIATFLEIAGGLILFFGCFFRFGALLLLIFLVPTTILFHAFWFQGGQRYEVELAMFLKNLAIIGSLLLLSLGPNFKKQTN